MLQRIDKSMGRNLTKITGRNFHHPPDLAKKHYEYFTTVSGRTRQGQSHPNTTNQEVGTYV